MDTRIRSLGEAKIPSPVRFSEPEMQCNEFVENGRRVLQEHDLDAVRAAFSKGEEPVSFEVAGPREKIYFDPSKTRCAIVTCGGLCPGLNDIIRSLVLELYHRYGVRQIHGIRHGLQGFIPKYGHDVLHLDPTRVERILDQGGTILGSSRGPQDFGEIVDALERMNVNVLFMVGGDGTLNAAHRLAAEITKRNLRIGVIGIPKTIDNDIHIVERSFGFDTAVDEATRAIRSAHTEAVGYPNGIGVIKLMGRNSGFIAATAALAQQDANFVLIPEVPFDFHGENGLLALMEARLSDRGHCVVVAAEGAGQEYFCTVSEGSDKDASGNVKLKDIGQLLKNRIEAHFRQREIPIAMKYVDPSYMIRSRPANPNDSVFCGFLARDAVHAAMAGKTDMLVGYVSGHFVHLPLALCANRRKHVDPEGKLWQAVLEATGQGSIRNAPWKAADGKCC